MIAKWPTREVEVCKNLGKPSRKNRQGVGAKEQQEVDLKKGDWEGLGGRHPVLFAGSG